MKEDLKNFFVIVPAYNEGKNIQPVLQKIISFTDNVIVVDDGSLDDTGAVAREVSSKILVLRHRINLGKGAALKTGCEAAILKGARILAMIDSDGQHLPEDMMRLTRQLIEKKLDIIFGERPFDKNMPFMMKFGNNVLSFLIMKLFKVNIADTQCGLRVFTKEAYAKIKWKEQSYSVETEIIVNSGKNKIKYENMTIDTIYNDNYKGTTFFDGILIFINLLKWKIQ